jgi:hypothetical protein
VAETTSVSEFGTYLGLGDSIDVPRALLVLQLAEDRCRTIVSPLPASAKGVVLDVAQRAYTNATGSSSETAGPFVNAAPSYGVSLTTANRRELRMIGGSGGAFTVDPTPADAGLGLYTWDQNQTWLNGNPELEESP